MHFKPCSKRILICMSVILLFTFVSCKDTDEAVFDIRVFEKTDPVEVVHKNLSVSKYEGGYEYNQVYDLYFYQESADFTEYYPDAQFVRKDFEYKKEYDQFALSKVYKNYLYFHLIDENKVNQVFRYDLTTGTEELMFVYEGTNPIAITTLNDKYIIWQEDENANWLRASLNCYDIDKGENIRFFTYSRDENNYMYSWNFDPIVLDGDHVYFDNIEKYEDKKAYINLYDYDITSNTVNLIAERRAAQPVEYKGLSWLEYDDDSGEYLLKSKNNSKHVRLGSRYFQWFASENIIVGQSNRDIDKDGIMYFDGRKSYPVIQSTNNIDRISCTDAYIVWDGWSEDAPIFFDIKNHKIIQVDCLEPGYRYAGFVNEDYLVFQAHEYIPDPEAGDSAITTKTLIYYFIKTSELDV